MAKGETAEQSAAPNADAENKTRSEQGVAKTDDARRDGPAAGSPPALDAERQSAFGPGAKAQTRKSEGAPDEAVFAQMKPILPDDSAKKEAGAPKGGASSDRAGQTKDGADRARDRYSNNGLSDEANKLLRSAEKKIFNPNYPNSAKELLQFQKDVEKFEREARLSNLPERELKQTYKNIQKLLDSTGDGGAGEIANGVRSERQRVRVAEQLMSMVARPEDRGQGEFSTCALASVEGILLTGKDRQPSKVTEMVSELALTGKSKVRGVDVHLDNKSMQSFGEHSANNTAGDGRQRLAENIFRLGVANLYFSMLRAEGNPEGQFRYTSGKDGNRLVAEPDSKLTPQDPEKRKEFEEKQKAYLASPEGPGPASTMTAESRILTQITGQDYKDRILVSITNMKDEDAKFVTSISSQSELEAHLQQLKQEKRLPAALAVQTNNQIFSEDQTLFQRLDKAKKPDDVARFILNLVADGHSLLITDVRGGNLFPGYDIKNTWGNDSNMTVSGRGLYDAMKSVPPVDVVRDLERWHQDNSNLKGHMDKYMIGLIAAMKYTVTQFENADGNTSAFARLEIQRAARNLNQMLGELPKDQKLQLEKVKGAWLADPKLSEGTKKFFQKWNEILQR